MASTAENITCGGFVFLNNFDSANLAKVEAVRIPETFEKDVYEIEGKPTNSSNSKDTLDYEFNLWTKHDCHGTQFQNNNRTWFYFGVKSSRPSVPVRFNVVNLNKQAKMFSQGMCPVFKIVPGHLHWERIREKPTYTLDQRGNDFALSFLYYTPENSKAVTYFAFTYPFSYTDLQNYLRRIDARMGKRSVMSADDIYYHRECAIKSLEDRRLDVLTISSYHNISTEREDRLNNMFPEESEERPYKFRDKKVIFISARVHPGETPSSFVLNGFLNFLLSREDQIAINLRRLYVFKLIPMLNPDGVAKGHYRMDTKGINLNRVYLNPSEVDHPTIYAAKNLIQYYHNSYQLPSELTDLSNINLEIMDSNVSIINSTASIANAVRDTTTRLLQQVTFMSLDEKNRCALDTNKKHLLTLEHLDSAAIDKSEDLSKQGKNDTATELGTNDKLTGTTVGVNETSKSSDNSGLYLYIDLHGHASKKGVFMYGNHFTDPEDTIACMLLPKVMSINNPNFHFTSCNFAERNMYIIDKRDGMSREGSGRVAVYKMTGLIRSYTLECNYNSGRLVNMIPARIRDGVNKTMNHMFVPPKYTPAVFEAVGAALGPSILDLTGNNPNSRLPNSQYRSLRGVKSHLKLTYVSNISAPPSKSVRKDNEAGDNVARSSGILKELETRLNDAVTGARNAIRSEGNLVKKCILRRGASFYTAVKRIKSCKKPRQTLARRALKNHCANNVENSAIICAIKSEVEAKPFMKTIDRYRSNRSKVDAGTAIGGDNLEEPRSNASKKPKAANSSTKTRVSSEETTAVRHGAKRLKLISSMRTSKPHPEVGESSGAAEETGAKVSPKVPRACDKQNVQGAHDRARVAAGKPSESSKLKKINKTAVKSSVLEESAKQNPK
ncbi:cytosolic carboxypeptidase-like protein 5 [Temnothorax curvispinosus]|uniref:tubulin-glutamate carboxypeptidase n=1 Tax=Temnothorax curvispinosus TaxID=300111 RepID=A0A6J1Q9Y9_9HYME|nr:cytosolic carboxypeptidase-like protein 5 [Temnothorax curvispinosus]XP_024879069.1 cytosolic carboxypeptidase-like protein 5 [Temnothorax curvispinosus]XP_024879070.1 cytosolic carboxypeptidase-like protein 5 [Temnothorax curvispinosus]XP_024879071.1 cytosolic carboxypeptidase-like protein 5 [Temnothorax curvispinosus]